MRFRAAKAAWILKSIKRPFRWDVFRKPARSLKGTRWVVMSSPPTPPPEPDLVAFSAKKRWVISSVMPAEVGDERRGVIDSEA